MYLFSVYIYLQLMRIKDKRKLIQNHLELFYRWMILKYFLLGDLAPLCMKIINSIINL